MKKIFIAAILTGCMVFGSLTSVIAQESDSSEDSENEYWESSFYGALYNTTDAALTYGPMTISVSADHISTSDDDSADYLWNEAETSVYYVNKIFDMASFDASTEEGIAESYDDADFTPEILSFDKFSSGDYDFIVYGMKKNMTDGSEPTYASELIAFDHQNQDNTLNSTLRIIAESASEDEIQEIVDHMKNVEIPSAPLTYEDTSNMGICRISIK